MKNKVVLITGTNSGFGWLTAQSVAALGYKVYATMRDTQGKNAEKAAALGAIENITVLDVSLTDDISVNKALDTIISNEGTIDILVNNAGSTMFGVAESVTAEDLRWIMDINFIAPWKLMKLALPFMRKQSEGLIVNISSGYGRISSPFFAAYSASKFALEGLSEGLHYELRPLGVDIAMIQPGGFPTEMSQKIQFGSDAAVVDDYKAIAHYPEKMFNAMGQMFESLKPNPQDVADAVVKLIGLPKGTRPLRTVVDPSTGKIIERANKALEVEHEKVLTAYGLQELLT